MTIGTPRSALPRSGDTRSSSEEANLFRATFDFAAIGMAIVALDGRFLEVNEALCDLVGYTSVELLATDFQTLTHPEDLHADLGYVGRLRDGEIRNYQMEKRYFHRNGEIVWIQLNVSLVRDVNDAPLYFLSQIQNITDRKRYEAELFQKSQQLRALINEAPDCICVVDACGRYTFVNAAIEKMSGRPSEDFIGKTSREIGSPDEIAFRWEAQVAMVFATGASGDLEIAIETIQGRRTHQLRLAPLHSAAGSIEAVLSVGRDVTEARETTSRLREAEERFDLAVRGANDGIWDWRPSEREVFYSPRCAEMLDYDEAEYPKLASDWLKAVHDDDVERVFNAFEKHLGGDTEFFDVEYRMRKAHGGYKWIQDRGRAVRTEYGEVDRMVGSRADVDSRKRMEGELENVRATLAKRVAELEVALAEVKELRGIVPICSYCKNVRDDENYWHDVEAYVGRHTDARFSHGICPTCYDKNVTPQLDALRSKRSDAGDDAQRDGGHPRTLSRKPR